MAQSRHEQQNPRKKAGWHPVGHGIALGLILLLLVLPVWDYYSDRSGYTEWLWRMFFKPLNDETFVPFVVTAREQIGPETFVVTVEPKDKASPAFEWYNGWLRKRHDPDHFYSWSSEPPHLRWYVSELQRTMHASTRSLQGAWRHGQWSVEVKQPQLQIAREYTPLPPRYGQETDDLFHGRLRFLVRAIDGGETSTYISRLRVDDQMELRGPHLGVDARYRMGVSEDGQVLGVPDDRSLVFVAGGTGIAPALQLARTVLDGNALGPAAENYRPDRKTGKTLEDPYDTVSEIPTKKPRVSIVWANRRRADCKSCEAIEHFKTNATAAMGVAQAGPIIGQLAEIKARHGDNFSVTCTVDEECSFVNAGMIMQAATSAGSAVMPQYTGAARYNSFTPDCPYHGQESLEHSTGRDPALPKSLDNTKNAFPRPCSCLQGHEHRSGRNLLLVSGPEGFIAALAGPKKWAHGKELQGPVSGAVGDLMRKDPEFWRNWLVLKL